MSISLRPGRSLRRRADGSTPANTNSSATRQHTASQGGQAGEGDSKQAAKTRHQAVCVCVVVVVGGGRPEASSGSGSSMCGVCWLPLPFPCPAPAHALARTCVCCQVEGLHHLLACIADDVLPRAVLVGPACMQAQHRARSMSGRVALQSQWRPAVTACVWACSCCPPFPPLAP